MDKNMINIDDLMRRRLGGAEEREPAGAWGAMKDLLDKEMPVQSTAATNWRRMLGYATGLIIAATVTVGGYKMVSTGFTSGKLSGNLNATSEKASSSIAQANHSSIPGSSSTQAATTVPNAAAVTNTTTNPASASSSAGAGTDGQSVPGNRIDRHTSTSNHQNTTGQTGNHNHSNTAAGNHHVNTNSIGGSTTGNTTSVATNTRGNAQNNRHTASNNNHTIAGIAGSNTPGSLRTNTAGNPTVAANNQATTATDASRTTAAANTSIPANDAGYGINKASQQASTVPSTSVTNRQAASTTGSNRNNMRGSEMAVEPSSGGQQRNNTVTAVNPIIPASGVNALPNGNNINLASNAGNRTPVKRIDSIHQIEVMYHLEYNPETDKKVYRKDTLGHRKIGVERQLARELAAINANDDKKLIEESSITKNRSENNLALSNKSAKTEAAATPVLNAALTAEAVDNNNNLISLSKLRVESKFNRIWDANAQRFNAFVQNVNIAISKAQFYAGITGGFNTTVFSANTLAGFQLGMTGLLAFNERWSIAADLKYYHRFNTASISDNYLKVSNIIPGSQSTVNGVTYREYTWDQENVIHYYNLTAVQTLELPVTLRRNIGRIFGEAGLNMMYSFNINAEEVERSQNNGMTVTKSFPMNTSPGESLGANKHVTLQDFRSRFGLGYVLGAGYEFTPAVNANIRLVQNFWDNASGSSGAAKVSRNLFQTPSVQFSIGYRFSQGRH